MTGSRPRRRSARAGRIGEPRTIVPVVDAAPGPTSGEGPADASPSPFDLRVDAARERLRRAIPPVDDGVE